MDRSVRGLLEQPFSQPALPDRVFAHAEARQIQARIHEAVERRGGLVLLTGEPGIGKTTLLQWALSTVSLPNQVVSLPFPVSGEDLLRRIAGALGLSTAGAEGAVVPLNTVRSALVAKRDTGGCVVVAIDQAHRVTDETLIMLGLLMAPVRDLEPLMAVILVAHPDLERQLARLRKAGAVLPVAVSCRLGPLSAGQVRAYVEERVRQAGGDPAVLLEPDVVPRLVANTSGIPRRIDTICVESFRAAAAAGRPRISGALIDQVARGVETWSAWRLPVVRTRATRRAGRQRARSGATGNGWRRRVRTRATLDAGRLPVMRARAALSLPSRPTVSDERAESAGAPRDPRYGRRAVALCLGTLSLFGAALVADLYLRSPDRSAEVNRSALSDEATTLHPPAPTVTTDLEPRPPVQTAPEPEFAQSVVSSPESRGVEQPGPPLILPPHETSQQTSAQPRPDSGSTLAPAVGDPTTPNGPPAALPTPPAGADYPTKPVQLMVAYPAGGSTDVTARIAAVIAEKELGQPLVVVNKTGADGQVGWTEMARQRPDGYSIGFINLPGTNTVILDPERKAAFGIDAFTPIINQVLDPGVIWVKADSPYRSLKEVIEAASKSPNRVSAATTGILSDDHLAILMVEESAGAVFRIVHFEGGAPMMSAVLGGRVAVAFDNVGRIVKRVKSREVRALAVMDTQRSKFLPQVPTTVELGYPSVISSSTRGIAGPRGLPEPVVKKLQDVFRKAMEHPDHVKNVEKAGLAIKVMVGDEYEKYYRDLHAKATKYTELARSRPGSRILSQAASPPALLEQRWVQRDSSAVGR